MINIALLGTGKIARTFLNIFEKKQSELTNLTESGIKLKYLLFESVQDLHPELKSSKILTDDFSTIVNDPELDIVIDLTAKSELSLTYCQQALQNNKLVVSNNCRAIANNFVKLVKKSTAAQSNLFFDNSVLPTFFASTSFDQYLLTDEVIKFDAILNGTTNYILSVMEAKTISLKETLARAEEFNYILNDPDYDLEGYASAARLALLCNRFFNTVVEPELIPVKGIKGITSYDLIYAAELGYKIKLVATVLKVDNKLELAVRPRLIKKDKYLASVSGNNSGIELLARYSKKINLTINNTSSEPVAQNIITDLIRAIRFLQQDCVLPQGNKYTKQEHTYQIKNLDCEIEQSFYVRLQIEKSDELINKIKQIFTKQDLAELFLKDSLTETPLLPLIIKTKNIKESHLEELLTKIESLAGVLTVNNIIPIKEK
ncbi:homoserine dehydrogenase [Halanaerobium salsuginis]|uniref:Homoserine dehydrogenase n=1 Tax=Halanaerobium salsuginis TaxID=29563 RepID=A0A1I4F7G0_9FIRM|nr:homoserine dehydrogenase [Halanaerobium salsuginis]SFL13908.1 homoserine dehydrogenase [Halanaerobium salsuginis]